MARRKPLWSNLGRSEGVEPLERRSAMQGIFTDEGEINEPTDDWAVVDPQPKTMVVIVDEADPHANERNHYTAQYGVLYVDRDDVVLEHDRFWYRDPDGQRHIWGVLGQARWNIDHALTGFNFGVKQFRIRKGG